MKEIQAHKIILRSASQFFRNILGKLLNQRPLLFLKGIQNSELLPIVNFIYLGRTEVAQDDLINFIGAATTLQVEGLILRHKEKRSSEARAFKPNP